MVYYGKLMGKGLAMYRWAWVVRLVGIGFYIAACIILPLVLGVWFDHRFDTGVVFALIGLVLGLVAAFFGTYRMVLPVLRGGRKDDEEAN